MAIAQSRLTSQGQISVPAEVRRRLGLGPGSVLDWVEDGDRIVVQRAGRRNWDDIHAAAFPEGPPQRRTLDELKDGPRRHARQRHARR
jgi:antitoxin PrlF